MIYGIGIDTVNVSRFAHWSHYSRAQLRRIFSDTEIDYCLQTSQHTAQRFAARFAVREALYKALANQGCPQPPFLTLCAAVIVKKESSGALSLIINWYKLPNIQPLSPLLSVSHTDQAATAIVLLQYRSTQTPQIE